MHPAAPKQLVSKRTTSAEVTDACSAALLHYRKFWPLCRLAKHAILSITKGGLREAVVPVHYTIGMCCEMAIRANYAKHHHCETVMTVC